MVFSISKFSAEINKRGVALNNLFVMRITPPAGLQTDMPADEMQFYCRSVALPQNQFDIQATKRQGYGPNTSYPSALEYGELTCEIVVDHEMHTYNFFKQWQQLIYNYNLDKGVFGSNGNQGVYEFAYKKKYVSTVEVDVYTEHTTEFKQTFKFFSVWPQGIGSITLAWQNAAEVMIAPISLKYSGFTDSGLISNSVNPGTIDSTADVAEVLDVGITGRNLRYGQ